MGHLIDFFTEIASLSFIVLSVLQGSVRGITFTFTNQCSDTVWPGVLANSGTSPLETTGFALSAGESRALHAPVGWSGRFWARTGCNFDRSGKGSCATGDCGSGEVECRGKNASPPATLAEFTLDGSGGQDFYDVSLVDGYNLPMVVEAAVPGCPITGCFVDLNERCPDELRTSGGRACRSACEAFGRPEYCCNGEYSNPNTCHSSPYSEMFKTACPKSYSYAYDDATSTFTCNHTDYSVTFCPSSSPNSEKSSKNPSRRPSDEQLEDSAWLATLAASDAEAVISASMAESLALQVALAIAVLVLLSAQELYLFSKVVILDW